ncbi:polysaccharide deacetylase family protein [Natronorarus salvus]|uniref:polysaccharide deacetylase family protein n=1 Tax=Natronorarus salvus TaxID=3117733 RepID=UPI002F26BE4B
MRRLPSRRTFLGAIGAASVGLAGCSDGNGDDPDDTDDDDPDDTGDDDPDDTGDDDPDDDEETPEEPEDVTPPAIGHGTLVSDFSEDLESWIAMTGDGVVDGDEEAALVGETAALVRGEGERAGVFRAFDEFDAADQHVSFAVSLEEPMGGHVNVEILAPFQSDSVITRRRIPRELDGWMRMDVGYTQDRGEPDFGSIEEMRIWVDAADGGDDDEEVDDEVDTDDIVEDDAEETDDENDVDEPEEMDETVRFLVDDLRSTPAADRGQVMFTFNGGFESHYTTLFDVMQDRDLQGVIGIVPPTVNVGGRLSIDQMREMRDAGWDMASFPLRNDALPEMESEEKRQVIEGDQSYLEGRGFEEGSRTFIAPYNRIDAEALEVVREVHDCSITFGGSLNAAPPADPHMLSRINAADFGPVEQFTGLAERHNQLLVLSLDEVGDDGDLDEEEFEDLLDFLEDSELDILTASEMLDRRDELL